jgi:hypothetical protein
MVERFFAEITRNRIRRGAFKSVTELKSAIMEYLENHNADPKPFVWTNSAGQILEKVARAKQALESHTSSSRSSQLALLDWLSALNQRIRLFRAGCGPYLYSRNFILWKPTRDAWSDAVAAVTDDWHECRTLRVSPGFHARSVAWWGPTSR